MNLHQGILLCAVGAIAGALNAVAGGGSFISFPTLLFTGVPPVPANATNTLALWLGATASGGAYRSRLNISRRVMIPLVIASIIGGVLGAILLIKTPASTFLRVLPWLLLGATLLFTFGKHLTRRISARVTHDASTNALVGASLFELLVAIYGGYFGGGIGILMLGMMTVAGYTDVNQMNGIKTLLSGCLNAIAVVTFALAHQIVWRPAVLMAVAAIAGGYAGGWAARRVNPARVRVLVIVIGTAMTIYFFVKNP